MFTLSYKTRGGAEPTGKQRVFFTCCPDDFDKYFDEISDDILASQNCAIYYIGKEAEAEYDEELFRSYLSEMRLIVIPVTTNLLTRPSRALDVVYKFAQERHTPVLTLMQEDGLVELYTRAFGDLQFLDKHAKDDTAIPFEKKLADYLSSVLVGDELAEKVRAAFDAYIFLSYRKKDRVHAQELMRLIHKNDFCRDIAIWYDEFLTPGEGFNGAIKAALEKSSLFALAVTPNLLEDGNYVMTEEYPMAKNSGKPILPAEVVGTDRKALEAKYIGIPECTNAHDAPKLSESLLASLESIAKRENDDDQEHNFMIGLAYLTGIDVEVNVDRALGLITGAAEAGVVEAIEKLVDMYRSGDGVERDYLRAIEWQEKLAAIWEARYRESGSDDDALWYIKELGTLGDYWYDLRRLSEAKACYEKVFGISKTVAAISDGTGQRYARGNVSVCCSRLGDIAKKERLLSDARDYYEESLQIRLKLAEEEQTALSLRYLSACYNSLGDVARAEGHLAEAREYYEKSLQIRLKLAEEEQTEGSRGDLSASYNKLGSIAKAEGHLTEAREYYEMSLQIRLKLAEETKTAGSRRDLSVCYENLGGIARAEGQLTEARRYYEKTLEIDIALAEEIKTVKSRRGLSVSYNNLGRISEAEERLAEARGYYEKSLEIRAGIAEETKTVESRRDLSVSYNNLGRISEAEGQLAEARGYYEKAFEIAAVLAEETETVESRRDLYISCCNLGDIAKAEGHLTEAWKYYDKANITAFVLARETQTVESRRDLSVSYNNLGDTAKAEGRHFVARGYYEKSLEIRAGLAEETKTVESRRDLSACYNKLGDTAKADGQLSDALEYYKKAFEIDTALAEEVKTARSRRALSVICSKLGDTAKADGQLSDARDYYEKMLEIDAALAEEVKTVRSYDDLAVSYYNLGILYYPTVDRDRLLKAYEIWERLADSCPEVSKYGKRRDIVKNLLDQ